MKKQRRGKIVNLSGGGATSPLPRLSAPEAAGVRAISSASGQGVEELKEFLWKFVEEAKLTEAAEAVEDL